LTSEQILELTEQVASVIDLARDKGIVHRDLKPQNLRLATEGTPQVWKVLDFGVAALKDSSGTLTQGGVVGTPAYMSPEQARSEKVDHRADLYALAAIIYRCTVGRPPYSGKDLPALLYQLIHEMPVKPSIYAEVSEDVERVIAIGLAKDRDERFANASDVVVALRAANEGQLPAELRTRADKLLEANPWTTSVV